MMTLFCLRYFCTKYFCTHTQRRQHRRFRSFATTWLRPTHKFFSRLDKSYLGAESCNRQFRLNPRYLFRKLRCQLVSAAISPAINSSLLQTKRLNHTNLMFPFIKFFFTCVLHELKILQVRTERDHVNTMNLQLKLYSFK